MRATQGRKATVTLFLVLLLSGALSLYFLQLKQTSQVLTLADADPWEGLTPGSIELLLAVAPFSAGTSIVLSNSLTGSLAGLTSLAVAVGTVVAERRQQERVSRLRDRVIDEVASNPGIHLRELHRSLGCAMGALQYHLRQLELGGQLVSVKNGNARHFFPSDFSSDPQTLRLASYLRSPVIGAILELCNTNDRITQADLSRTLSMDKSLVSYYVGQLIQEDILNTVRVFGREKPLVLTDWAHLALVNLTS
ncbi:MAG: hypothetical protein C4K49_04055 [Candidatus Thorarchaeota archaeon]|nr:MAG: hypothetical protein C4K49_04055 [Candidatus Thorarchaeota archaeon]